MGLLRKVREIGTVRTPDVVREDVRDAERLAERMPTVRNLERLERLRVEAAELDDR